MSTSGLHNRFDRWTPMIRLCYSNRTEALLDRLAEEVAAERGAAGPWQPAWIAVPNRQVARIVRERMASRQGIAASLEFRFLDELVREHLPADARVVDRVAVQGILLRRFRSGEGMEAEALAPLRRYLAGADPDRRLAQLAFKLAGLFEEYLVSRPDWFPLWEAGRDLPAADELGQCEGTLWRLVRGDFNASAQGWLLPAQVPARLRPGPAARLHLFGMAHLAPVYQRILDALGRIVPEVWVYALNPCREFWDDLRSADEERRRQRRVGPIDAEGGDGGEDPYGLQAPRADEPPLLRRWGRPGREKIHLLNEMTDWDFEPAFEDPPDRTLLAALQRDLLDRRPPRRADPLRGADGSLEVHACPTPRREAETIAERIWALLRTDPARTGGAPLRFSDIAVLVPAATLDRYSAHLAAAFGGAPAIPFTELRRGGGALPEQAEALGLLFDLVGSALGRGSVLGFFAHPAVRRRFAGQEMDRWPGWCEAAGIVRGADRADLQPAYFEEDALSWDQGHRRIALGAFMAAEGEAFEAGGLSYPPCEAGAGAWDAAGAFLLTSRALVAELRGLAGERRSLEGWGRRFAQLLEAWIGARGPADLAARARLRAALARLGALQPEGLDAPTQPFATAAELARQELARAAAHGAGSRLEGVALGDLESLRGIPFRVVFVAGLGESDLPGREPADALDLRARRRLPGDVPAHERDRYLFLEALLCARERFILSYVSRDPTTGEPLQPSPLIEELLEAAGATLGTGPTALVHEHPLLRWDPQRFEAHPDLLPASPAVYHEARLEAWRRAGRPDPPPAAPADADPPELPATAEPARLRITLSALQGFLESPLQGAARAVLGLGRDGDDPAAVEEEPDRTERYRRLPLLREAFWTARLQGLDPAAALQRLRRGLERDGLAPLGLLGQPERDEDLRVLARWAELVPPCTAPRFLRLGGSGEVAPGLAQDALPPLELDVALEGGAQVRVELAGSLEPQADLGRGPGTVFLLDGDFPDPAARLRRVARAWLDQLVGCLAGQDVGARVVYLMAAGKVPRSAAHPMLAPVEADEARARLAGLLGELLRAPHDRLLPLEVVADGRIETDAQLAEWLEAQLEHPDRARFADLHGPVPNPLAFPVADAAALAARRRLLQPVLAAGKA